jgi:hypothetical protein
MSVTRVGELLQPVSVRTVVVLSDARLQSLVNRTVRTSAQAADILVALVTPAAVTALVMGLWRLTADLGWTETFPISAGFFSHWMVWIALAMGLKFGATVVAAKLVPVAQGSAASSTIAEKSIENREPF